jgi:SAM-dependent methyltransferase
MIPMINPFSKNKLQLEGDTYVDLTGQVFPIVNGVPRFVGKGNYTENFGFQWNKFQKTQIDRESKQLSFSKERFFTVTGWDKEDLTGKDVLEAGSGAGRFSQIVLDYTKANLYSIDYSDAVSANYRNNGHHGSRFHLSQASIYEMPFPDESFDKVFCFGVLQHTPDFKKSVQCLIEKTKKGGEIVVDFYPVKGWYSKVNAKYLLRPVTKKMKHEKLLKLIEGGAGTLIRLYGLFEKIGVGKYVNRFLPVVGIKALPQHLSKDELREWVILDTFDMFSPEYDNPQRISTVKQWFEEFGVEVTFAGMMTYAHDVEVAVVKGIRK